MTLTSTTSLPKSTAIFWLLFFILSNFMANAQTLGMEPPSTKWNIIKTQYADIIYEPGVEIKAQRVANLIDYIGRRDSSFIGGPAQHVPIILHSQSTLPAGVPILAPWRSDWSLAAPQDPFFGSMLWVDGLTIHEYRHHQQMTRAKHGWYSDFLRVVMGQTGWFIGVLTVQPNWFFEGDATYAETVLSNGGRGRMPKFDREYRTMRLSGLGYNYEKASRYSRKDFVPNIYREGYYLTSYARKHFGIDIWTKALEDTYKKKGIFYPFSRSLKSLTGYQTKDLYNAAMEELDSMWKAQDQSLELTESSLISLKTKKVYTDYKYPQFTSTGKVLTEKSSFQQIRTYYLIDPSTGKEEKLFQPGNITTDHVNLSLSGDLITWSENRFHPRWNLKDYGVIFTYNLKNGEKKQLTHKTRFFSPSASSNGEKIAVLELGTDGVQHLVLLDGQSGIVLKEFDNPEFGQYAYPRFTQDDKYIIVGYTNINGNTIHLVNIESGEAKALMEFSDKVSTRPFDMGDYIYFSGTHTGINNIFAIRKKDGEIFQITSSRFGAYMPAVSVDGKKMIFSEYTANGFEIREMLLEPGKYKPFNPDTESTLTYYQSLAKEEGGNITGKVPVTVYESERYNPLVKGLLKIHSWTPSLDQNEYGLEVISNNIMSNTSANLGYRYNTKENTSVSYGGMRYGAFFPVFNVGYSYNLRNSKNIYDEQYSVAEYSWPENQFTGGISFPFRLSSGTYSSNLTINGQFDYFSISNTTLSESITQGNSFTAAGTGIEFLRIKSRSIQQIQPVWGQTFSLHYRQSFEDTYPAGLSNATAAFYFPGLQPNHSFYIKGAYQEEKLINTYRFENTFQNSRGYQERYFSGSVNTDFEEIKLASINYFFPIAFPDISLGSIAYFQSITANLFYDHSEMSINGNESFMRSAGIDLAFEFTSLRLFKTSLILRGLHRFDLPDPEMKPFLFDVLFEITDLSF